MDDADLSVEKGGFTEYDKFFTYFVTLCDILYSVKPYELNVARTVSKECLDAALFAFSLGSIKVCDVSTQLDVIHSLHQLVNVVKLCAVNITVRKVVEQVPNRLNLKMLFESFSTMGTYSLEVHYVLI